MSGYRPSSKKDTLTDTLKFRRPGGRRGSVGATREPSRTHRGRPYGQVLGDRVAELRNGYPFHPELMATLNDKLATLDNFQRVRGMLRLLPSRLLSHAI